jgi:hypothetical protein
MDIPQQSTPNQLLRDRLIADLSWPKTLAGINPANSSSFVRRELPNISNWARDNSGNLWELHRDLGIEPRVYNKKGSGLNYKKADPRRIARAIWQPPGNPEEIAKKLKKDLKQNLVPKSPSDFFSSNKFKTWLKENNFHDLRDFTEFFDIPLITSHDGSRKQTRIDIEKLVPEIWPVESLNVIYTKIKELSPKRPSNLQEYFVASNNNLMKLLHKQGFQTLIDFFRHTGVVIKDEKIEESSPKDPVIDFQKLARKIWVKPNGSDIARKVKQEVQAQKPSNARDFFNGEPFRDWLAKNGFSKLSEFSRQLGVAVKVVRYQNSPKLKIDYLALIDKIWIKANKEELSQSLKKDLNQDTRPTKPKDFFTSSNFKSWLAKNNFDSLVSFGEFFEAKIINRVSTDTSRNNPRQKTSREVDYDSLAQAIWLVPSMDDIQQAMSDLKASEELKGITSPYKIFNSRAFRTWLQKNNFRDLVHFCEKIGVRTSKRSVADRKTGKVSYDWQAMSKKLGI